jgi:hypothetical protein
MPTGVARTLCPSNLYQLLGMGQNGYTVALIYFGRWNAMAINE